MSTVALETFLARLYTDAASLEHFNADPEGEALRAGLSEAECQALVDSDRVGLQMAAQSFGEKRARYWKPRMPLHRRAMAWLFRL